MKVLTIENVRKDIGHDTGYEIIGGFKLIDGGKSSGTTKITLEYPYYTFFWSYKDEPRRFKVVVKREPDDEIRYHLWIEDLRMGVRIYDARVKSSLFVHRERFYHWMVDMIIENL